MKRLGCGERPQEQCIFAKRTGSQVLNCRDAEVGG